MTGVDVDGVSIDGDGTQHHVLPGNLHPCVEEIGHQFVVLMCIEGRGSVHGQPFPEFMLQRSLGCQKDRLQQFRIRQVRFDSPSPSVDNFTVPLCTVVVRPYDPDDDVRDTVVLFNKKQEGLGQADPRTEVLNVLTGQVERTKLSRRSHAHSSDVDDGRHGELSITGRQRAKVSLRLS